MSRRAARIIAANRMANFFFLNHVGTPAFWNDKQVGEAGNGSLLFTVTGHDSALDRLSWQRLSGIEARQKPELIFRRTNGQSSSSIYSCPEHGDVQYSRDCQKAEKGDH